MGWEDRAFYRGNCHPLINHTAQKSLTGNGKLMTTKMDAANNHHKNILPDQTASALNFAII